MASTPLLSTTGEQPVPADAAVAIVAADQFAARRMAAALSASGLGPTEVASSVEELLRERPATGPNAVVLSCDPGLAASLAAIRTLASGFPRARLVLVSPARAGSGVRQALGAGADGVVDDAEIETALGPATCSVLAGQLSLPRHLHRCAVRPAFSHREKQVLALVVRGHGNRQIAARLFLAESTVKSHLASAFQKLGVRSRKEAAALLLDPDEGLGIALAGVELDQPIFGQGVAPR